MHYVGILDGKGTVWGVRVPDLPGCYGGGTSPREAVSDAIAAARDWAAHQRASGAPISMARSIDEVRADPEAAFDAWGETLVLIPLVLDKARLVRANISLDAGLLEAIDEAAQRRGLTRSAFLASAAMDKIAQTA